VDGVSNDSGIAQLFASNYKNLYTSVPCNAGELMKIIEANNVNVMQNGFTSDCIITVDEVRKAVNRLKAYKSDGGFELNTDHFLNKKYVLWNVGICPIASKVGHVILATPPLGSFIVPYVVLAMAYPTKKKTKSLPLSI